MSLTMLLKCYFIPEYELCVIHADVSRKKRPWKFLPTNLSILLAKVVHGAM